MRPSGLPSTVISNCENVRIFSILLVSEARGGLGTYVYVRHIDEAVGEEKRWCGAEQRGPLKRHPGKARSRSSALKSGAVTIGHNRSHIFIASATCLLESGIILSSKSTATTELARDTSHCSNERCMH